MESMRARDVEEVGLSGDLSPRKSKQEINNHSHHHHHHYHYSSNQSTEDRDFTDTDIAYNVKDEEGELEPEIQTENKGTKTEVEEDVAEGEVVNSEDSSVIGGGSFDFTRNYNFVEQIRVSGSKHTNGHTESEHQITSYSSQETTISDCISKETYITKIPEIVKGQSSIAVNIREQEEDVEVLVPDEYDVEKVLEKQEAYDLFCPNCKSCITKRVILRRRKRKAEQISATVVVPEPEPQPEPVPVSAPIPPQQPEVTDETRVEEKEPIFYRCLSCFSIFIPSGWLRRRADSNVIQRDQPPTDSQPTTDSPPPTVRPDVSQVSSSQTPTTTAPTSMNEPIKPGVVSAPDVPSLNFTAPAVPGLSIPSGKKENQTPIANEAISKPQPDIVETMALPTINKPIFSGEVEGGEEKVKVPASGEISSTGNELETDEKKKGVMLNTPSEGGPSLPSKPLKLVPIVIGTGETDGGRHVAISMPVPLGSVTQPSNSSTLTEPLLPVQTIPASTTTVAAAPSVAAAAATTTRVSGPGIMKSMVYGGLLEAIASLSVVSAAAGADTATLNILALGIANLFGGLFALGHKLRVLKYEATSDKYEEALGEPGHFTLHATVAVLSYILFGAIPAVVYAFSFRESDVRDYKMIVVAVASLLSVVMLSVGKAYVRSSDKKYWKTMTYYVTLAVMASGVSFVVGDCLDWLLQKLGWFTSSTASVTTAWMASY